jgi:hypothetical protein
MLACIVVKSICFYVVAFLTPQIRQRKPQTAFVNSNFGNYPKISATICRLPRARHNGKRYKFPNLFHPCRKQQNTRKRPGPSRILNLQMKQFVLSGKLRGSAGDFTKTTVVICDKISGSTQRG